MKQIEKIKLNKSFSIIFLIMLFFCVYGGVLFPVLYKITEVKMFLYAGAVKDALLFLLVIVYIMCFFIFIIRSSYVVEKAFLDLIFPILVFFILFLLSCIKGKCSVGVIITIFRRYFFCPLLFIIFALNTTNENKILTYSKHLIIIACLFGLFEYFQDSSFWNTVIELPKYWKDSGDRWAEKDILKSGRFISYDLYFLLRRVVRRMCSTFAEPTNFSSFIISGWILYQKNKPIKWLCFICCCLAISKAALLVIFGLFPVLFCYDLIIRNKRWERLYLLMLLILFLISAIMQKLGLTLGPFSHIAGFYTGVMNVLKGHIFGEGVGTVGNYAAEVEGALSGLGGESGIGGMLAQCGIGTVFYVYFFYRAIKLLSRSNIDNKKTYIKLIFAWTVICCFSESAFGVSGNILFFSIPGIGINKVLRETYDGCVYNNR